MYRKQSASAPQKLLNVAELTRLGLHAYLEAAGWDADAIRHLLT
jgi:hypothetical protein